MIGFAVSSLTKKHLTAEIGADILSEGNQPQHPNGSFAGPDGYMAL